MKKNTKVTTIDDLAIMVANGFDKVDQRFDKVESDVSELKSDISELKEGNKNIRRDILNLGDRFVSFHTFGQLASRVSNLEKKIK